MSAIASKKLGFLFCIFIFSTNYLSAQNKTELTVPGLKDKVEVLRDQWGVNHIYAKNENDLFFTQGYCSQRQIVSI